MLGVDPGSRHTGFGVLDTDGRVHRLIECGVLTPAAGLSLPERLRHIHEGIAALIARHRVQALAVEDVFHAANTHTALVLGHVRGVVLLAGAEAGLPVHEYPPATVKQQITGSGRADKRQVAWMVSQQLGPGCAADAGDAADALAVALCFAACDARARTAEALSNARGARPSASRRPPRKKP